MNNVEAIDQLVTEAKGLEEPLLDEDDNEITTEYITGRLTEIGEKITAVSTIQFKQTYLAVFATRVFDQFKRNYSNL